MQNNKKDAQYKQPTLMPNSVTNVFARKLVPPCSASYRTLTGTTSAKERLTEPRLGKRRPGETIQLGGWAGTDSLSTLASAFVTPNGLNSHSGTRAPRRRVPLAASHGKALSCVLIWSKLGQIMLSSAVEFFRLQSQLPRYTPPILALKSFV